MIFGTTDKTVPFPPPDGYKWHVRMGTGPYFLQLWKEGVEIPEAGLDQLIGCEVESYFERPKQIRQVSRHVIRALEQKHLREAEADFTAKRVNG